ncbi:MAG: hypothetical protein R3C18_18055 [Planctomycetaceae bacterium]
MILQRLFLLFAITAGVTHAHAGEVEFAPISWAGVSSTKSAVYGHAIEHEGRRYLYYSGGIQGGSGKSSSIFLRVGSKTTDGWIYGGPKQILTPTPRSPDQLMIDRPCVVEGRFKTQGANGTSTFNFLMCYHGLDAYPPNGSWRVFFAVSDSVTGPWKKVGQLFLNDREFDGKVSTMSMSMDAKNSDVRLFYCFEGTPCTQLVNIAHLESPVAYRRIPIPLDGLTTGSGADEVRFLFPKFCVDGDSLLTIRSLTEDPSLDLVYVTNAGDVSKIPLTGVITGKPHRWETMQRFSCPDDFPANMFGFCGFVCDTRGHLLKGEDGSYEVLVTVQDSVDDIQSRKIHTLKIKP